MFGIMFAAVLAMAGMPSAWCAAFPLSTMAALLIVQQRGGAVASIKLPGSRLLMVMQGCLLAIWGCGVLPTSVLLAPLPAVAIYFAAAHSVTRKLRPLNAGVFLLIILILAGSVPACFIDVEVPTPVPAPTITVPTAVRAATGRAAQMSRSYHLSPAAATSTSSAAATTYNTASMAGAAMAYFQTGVPSKLLPGCGVQLPAALRAQMATEGDHSEWMHDSGADNKHISPFITDFAEWTSSAVTTLGGVGSEALMQYGTGNVRMLALDSMNRPYCYTLYNVRYVPQSRVYGSWPRSRRGCETSTCALNLSFSARRGPRPTVRCTCLSLCVTRTTGRRG
jgi:hypothetical protein